MQVEVIVRQAVQALDLKQRCEPRRAIARAAQRELGAQPEIAALGLEVLGVSIIASSPRPTSPGARGRVARSPT
jgi:hypothetical protein